MTFFTSQTPLRRTSLLGLVISTSTLVSCASIPAKLQQSVPSADRAEPAAESVVAGSPMEDSAEARVIASDEPEPASAPASLASQPQLIKQAHLTLILSDPNTATDTVREIVSRARGDLLAMQDNRSPQSVARQISLTLRVPQNQLDAVLAEIRVLGTVEHQSITAEDVSNQLVDLDARLKNLRQSEAALLQIMERSGEIADVLEVSRELSNVRETIERMAAQQQSLRRQITYSYIYLNLQSSGSTVLPLRPATETLSTTWKTATRSVKAFTIGGLKISLWLLAYSPYLVLIALIALGSYRLWHPARIATPEGDHEQE